MPLSAVQPGDLIFYYSDIHHVGIYVGGGQIIAATHTGDYVRYRSMYYTTPVGAGPSWLTATLPYGSWPSPVSSAALVEATVGLSQVAVDGDDIYWSESRPLEAGRVVVVRNGPDGGIDAIPAGFSARTTVHEYGGGAYAVDRGRVVFANFEDQRLYRVDVPGAEPVPITPEPRSRWVAALRRLRRLARRHREWRASARRTTVRRRPTSSTRSSCCRSTARARPRSSPPVTTSTPPRGGHPMARSWPGCRGTTPTCRGTGPTYGSTATHVAGGRTESIVQPEWSPDGVSPLRVRSQRLVEPLPRRPTRTV